MSDSKAERQRKNRARRAELQQRKAKAYRRRQGLTRDEEEAELASYFRRFVAFAFDQIIYFFFYMFFLVFVVAMFGEHINPVIAGILPFYLFGTFYFIAKIRKNGQTSGCKKAKIVVIREDGKGYLDTRQSFIRWAVYYGFPLTLTSIVSFIFVSSSGLLFAGFLYILITAVVSLPIIRTPLRQGMHDKLAGAVVVREISFDEATK